MTKTDDHTCVASIDETRILSLQELNTIDLYISRILSLLCAESCDMDQSVKSIMLDQTLSLKSMTIHASVEKFLFVFVKSITSIMHIMLLFLVTRAVTYILY